MTQEQINTAAEKHADKVMTLDFPYLITDVISRKEAHSKIQAAIKAGAALVQPEIERLKELVERYENALKSFGQSLTT